MDLKNILIKDPIYREYKHIDFTFEEQMNLFFYFEDDKITTINFLDCYCPICKKETVFKAKESNNRQEFNNVLLGRMSSHKNTFFDYFKDIGIFQREFSCSRNKSNEHSLIVIFKITGESFHKISQFPSIADLSNPNIEKYRKYNIQIYKEMNRAVGLASFGIGIASFVYLRRILEKHIVDPKIQDKIKENVLNKKLIGSNFKDKIIFLENNLPDFLTKNPKIYSVLSKGIHELEEEECLAIFPIVFSSIELILNQQMEKIEKLKKEQEISKFLNNL